MTTQIDGAGGVQSISRAIAILGCFTAAHPQLGVSDVAQATGLSTSTTHRILSTLAVHGFIERVDEGHNYRLGTSLVELAHGAVLQRDLIPLAKPAMTQLRDEIDETVGLHLFEPPASRAVVDQVESRQQLRRTYTEIGMPVPVHQGAPGKVLLAHLPVDARERILAGTLKDATSSTITDADQLREECERVQRRGYALSVEERVLGISTVGVPIFSADGGVRAALSVSAPSTRFVVTRLEEVAMHARGAAAVISRRLGHRPGK